jgi:phage RecT family recombinase
VTQLLPGTYGTKEAKGEAVARFCRQLMTAVDRNPTLLDCNRNSFWIAGLAIAGVGLDPSGTTGEAAIVPFKGVATPMIMARGYVVLAIRSGAAKKIEHGVVCEGDQFDYEQGSNAYVRHRIALGNRGAPIAVWAIAVLPTGESVTEIMNWEEVNAIRLRSRSADKGPWSTDPLEMGRKTVLRRIMKRLPWNADDLMGQLIEVQKVEDNTFGLGDLDRKPDALPAPAKAGLAGLRDMAARDVQALGHEQPQDVSKLATPAQPQAEPVRVASTPASAAASPKVAGPTCPRCRSAVDPMIADEVERMGNCPACANRK